MSFYSPGGIPARSEKGERLLLYIGIIDILQSYRLKKKLEHTFKSIIHDGVSIIIIIISLIKNSDCLGMARHFCQSKYSKENKI